MGIKQKIQTWWNSMSPAEKVNSVLRGITTGAAIGGAAFCIHEVRKSRDILRFAVSNIGDGVNVEVSQDLINVAVDRAANKQVGKAVQEVVNEKKRLIQEQTREEVEERVRDVRHQITEKITEKVAEECKKINEHDMMKEIRDGATEKLAEKLDKNLDAITDEYTKNLSNMGKVYEALADKLQSKA